MDKTRTLYAIYKYDFHAAKQIQVQALADGVDWSKIDKKDYLEAMRISTTDATSIKALLQGAMTDRIDDREIFMKGIDYSYYYEE